MKIRISITPLLFDIKQGHKSVYKEGRREGNKNKFMAGRLRNYDVGFSSASMAPATHSTYML